MAIPSLNGLIWRSQWNAPGEGPYSIMAKLIHANGVPPNYFKDVIRWRHPEGASLLFPKLQRLTNERIASFGRLLNDSSIARLARYMHGEVAGDQALRYCRTCMATGFQAAIAQIDGLDVCPIHKEPHLNSCVRCGTRTPPYYLGNGDRLPRFSCWKCGAPFGNGASIDRRPDAWHPPEHLDRLEFIHQWLKKIDDYWHISWPSLTGWDTTKLLDDEYGENRRRTIFGVIIHFVPAPNVPSPTIDLNLQIFGPYRLTEDLQSKYLEMPNYHFSELALESSKIDGYRQYFRTPSFGIPVPDDPVVPPAIHAAIIWTAQAKQFAQIQHDNAATLGLKWDKTHSHQTFFGEAKNSELVRQGFLAATWCAALRIATEWHQLLIDLRKSKPSDFDDNWRIACDRWSSRLGSWIKNVFFPVGEVITRDSITGEPSLYFIVA